MGLHPLLRNVPTDIVVAVSPAITRHFLMKSRFYWFLGAIWGTWFVFIPLTRLPITFGYPYIKIWCFPDYGTDNLTFLVRPQAWAIDFI